MLKKFCDFVVDKRKWFITIFLILTIVFAGLVFLVNINYDMTDYLPKDSEMTEAMDTMFTEFGEGAQASFMIKDINIKDVSAVRKKISNVENVVQVLWIDTALEEYYPTIKDEKIEFNGMNINLSFFGSGEKFAKFVIDNADKFKNIGGEMGAMVDMMLGQFYKDDNALIQVFFTENAYSKKTIYAIDDIKQIIADANYKYSLGGMAASAYAMETIMESELFKLVLIVAPTIILLLFLFTNSYFEPIIYLIVIGISVVLNMGSNVMMPSVSYLTFSIAALIQVAVSMDYSIFIMHSYKANRDRGIDKVESAKQALRKSLSSVSASSLTTIAGFIALMFMSYTIGADIGLVLAKGIVCSLITAFLFMPGLLVAFDKPIRKGEHTPIFKAIKNMARKLGAKRAYKKANSSLSLDEFTKQYIDAKNSKSTKSADKVSNNLLKLRFIVPILFVALLAPAFMVQNSNHFMYGELASSGGDGSTLMIDRADIEKVFGSQNAMVVLIDKKYENRELDLSNKLMQVENVDSAASLSVIKSQMGNMKVPPFMEKQFVGENYRMIMLVINSGEEDDVAFSTVDKVREVVKAELPDGYYLVGNSVVAQELKTINQKDYTLSTSLALLFIFIILLFTFKGIVLPLILALLIQGSIWFAMTIPAFANMPLVFLGYLIVSCFQMGCTIDYGILFSNNYLRFRETNDKLTACKLAFKASVGAVSLSAAILMTVGYTVGIAGSIPATSNIGLLLGIGATVSYLAMTYLLPLFLVLLDKPIMLTTLKSKRKAHNNPQDLEQNNTTNENISAEENVAKIENNSDIANVDNEKKI